MFYFFHFIVFPVTSHSAPPLGHWQRCLGRGGQKLPRVTPLTRHVWLAGLGPNMKNADRHPFSASSSVAYLTPLGIICNSRSQGTFTLQASLRVKERAEERARREAGNGVENRAVAQKFSQLRLEQQAPAVRGDRALRTTPGDILAFLFFHIKGIVVMMRSLF